MPIVTIKSKSIISNVYVYTLIEVEQKWIKKKTRIEKSGKSTA